MMIRNNAIISKLTFVVFFFLLSRTTHAQMETITADTKLYTSKFIKQTESSIHKYNRRTNNLNKKYINKYIKTENKAFKKLCKIDPKAAEKLFSYSSDPLFYNPKLFTETSTAKRKLYYSKTDTLKLACAVISQNDTCNDIRKIAQLDSSLLLMENNQYQSEALHNYFRIRKQQYKNVLITNPEFSTCFTKIDQLNYYYKEISNINVNDITGFIDKKDQQFLDYVKGTSEFKEVMDAQGQLSKFKDAQSVNSTAVKGFQTLEIADQLIQNDLGTLTASSKTNLLKLKESIDLVNISFLDFKSNLNINFADIPSFKPNRLKSLKFKDRISYNFNYQLGPVKSFYPTAVVFDLTMGYKIFYKWTFGAGGNYEIGTGSGWSDPVFSSSKLGFKSYIDFSVSKIFFLEGGYEKIKDLNHNSTGNSEFQVIGVQKVSNDDWFDRALLGIVIKKEITTKKQVTVSWLYDFLHNRHSPPSPALIYRIGWQW